VIGWSTPPIPLEPLAKVSNSETTNGKELAGVPVSGDATELSHFMC